MNRAWAPSALALEETLRNALADLGGTELARAAEADPAARVERLKPVLDSIGVLELDAFGGEDEASAAALAVRACGAIVAPWPLARVLSMPSELRTRAEAMYLVGGEITRLDHADLFEQAVALSLDGQRKVRHIRPCGGLQQAPLDPFGATVRLEEHGDGVPDVPDRAVLMSFVLDAFWVAGALVTVTRAAGEYARTRRQFGRPIGAFGEIKWRLADMVVATDGLDELAAYTWSRVRHDAATLADALALRFAMLESADVVLKNGHQVFGAIGLCEEHDLAVIDRHLASVLLRPAGSGETGEMLLHAVNRYGFDAIFPVAPRTYDSGPDTSRRSGGWELPSAAVVVEHPHSTAVGGDERGGGFEMSSS
jgi:acyl-CoA dehydrogenase